MNKKDISRAAKKFQSSLIKHSPEILTGFGIAGMLTTTVLAVKATPKAMRLLEEKKQELGVDKLTPLEMVKTAGKCYIPAATTGIVSAACMIGATSVNSRRNAVLATAYKVSETAFSEYKEKVVETIGEKQERVVQEKIDKDHLERSAATNSEFIVTEKGNTRCYDRTSGRFFLSDIDQIKKAINELNHRLNIDMYVSLNDLYDILGLPDTSLGEILGWNITRGLIEPRISANIVQDEPCIVLDFDNAPQSDYDSII